MVDFFKDRKNENELKQAIFRTVFTTFIFIYLLTINATNQEIIFISCYFLVGLISTVFLLFYKNTGYTYRLISLIADITATSYGLYLTSASGGIFLGVYLWLVTGYGLRYGKRMMVAAYFLCIAGFLTAVHYNEFWNNSPSITAGFLITLILIPIHVFSLLRKLAQQTEKAEKASKAKSAFLSHISHEIRTPLNGVIGAAELLNETKLDKEQKELSTIIVNSSTVVTDLISNVLDLSSIESGKLALNPSNTNLFELTKSVISLFRAQCEAKNIQLILEFNLNTDTHVSVDALRLKQIMINLIGNAIKFTDQGSITLRLDKYLTDNQSASIFKIAIIDTGIGMDEDALSKIFESFTQANKTIKEKFGGTGLGVTISNNLVQAMGGKLQVVSKIDKGTTFFFDLILPELEAQTNAATLDFSTPTPKNISENNAIKILVADDNDTNLVILKKLLHSVGYSVLLAKNGNEALDILDEESNINLMILDSNMPGCDGIEVIKAQRAMSVGEKEIPAIILSADATIEVINEVMKQGANAYLTKPINKEELFSVIGNLLSTNKSLPKAEVIPIKSAYKKQDGNVVDWDRIKELESLGLGSPTFMLDLIEGFIGDTQARLKELQAAYKNLDYKSIKFISHTIAGSAANIGSTQLANVAREINALNPGSKADKMNELVTRTIMQAFETSKKQLLDYELKNLNKNKN